MKAKVENKDFNRFKILHNNIRSTNMSIYYRFNIIHNDQNILKLKFQKKKFWGRQSTTKSDILVFPYNLAITVLICLENSEISIFNLSIEQ